MFPVLTRLLARFSRKAAYDKGLQHGVNGGICVGFVLGNVLFPSLDLLAGGVHRLSRLRYSKLKDESCEDLEPS